MRPLTDELPKPLIPVKGKSLIQYHIEKLVNAGIRQVVINHAWLGHKLEEMLGDGSQFKINIQYSPEVDALETAGGIVNALPLLGNDPFLVLNGDVYCDVNIMHFCSEPFAGLAKLLLVSNPGHNPEGDFGIENRQLIPKSDTSPNYTFSGIALYHPAFFQGLTVEKSPLAPLIRSHLQQNNLVEAQLYRGRWSDVGTPQRLAELEQELS